MAAQLPRSDRAFPLWGWWQNPASDPRGYYSFVIPDVLNRALISAATKPTATDSMATQKMTSRTIAAVANTVMVFLPGAAGAFALRIPVVNRKQIRDDHVVKAFAPYRAD